MKVITLNEFEQHFTKYSKLAQSEKLLIFNNGKLIFSIVPPKENKLEKAKSIIGIIPKNITFGIDLNERG